MEKGKEGEYKLAAADRDQEGRAMIPTVEMTAAHINKLATITRCPVCGDPYNDGLSYTVPDVFARRDFTCGAAFVTANARIVVATPCPAGSQVQADLLNREVEAPVQTVEKQDIGERNGDHH